MSDDYWERTKYNPNLRRDALYVAQSQGNAAAKIFWGGLAALCIFFWPLAVHGSWGIVAKAAWFGFLAICTIFVVALKWQGSAPPRGRLKVEATPPPGPDPAVTARLLRDLEAADGYAGLVEEALTGEELDYLQRHGMLTDGWPFRNDPRKG